MQGPSPTYPATEATPEFLAWFRKALSMLLPQTAQIVKTGQDHMPAMFAFPSDEDVMPAIIPVPQFFMSNTGKDMVSLLHREIANDDMVYAVILLTEAWVKLGVTVQK